MEAAWEEGNGSHMGRRQWRPPGKKAMEATWEDGKGSHLGKKAGEATWGRRQGREGKPLGRKQGGHLGRRQVKSLWKKAREVTLEEGKGHHLGRRQGKSPGNPWEEGKVTLE